VKAALAAKWRGMRRENNRWHHIMAWRAWHLASHNIARRKWQRKWRQYGENYGEMAQKAWRGGSVSGESKMKMKWRRRKHHGGESVAA
jgi:hypothetical protein